MERRAPSASGGRSTSVPHRWGRRRSLGRRGSGRGDGAGSWKPATASPSTASTGSFDPSERCHLRTGKAWMQLQVSPSGRWAVGGRVPGRAGENPGCVGPSPLYLPTSPATATPRSRRLTRWRAGHLRRRSVLDRFRRGRAGLRGRLRSPARERNRVCTASRSCGYNTGHAVVQATSASSNVQWWCVAGDELTEAAPTTVDRTPPGDRNSPSRERGTVCRCDRIAADRCRRRVTAQPAATSWRWRPERATDGRADDRRRFRGDGDARSRIVVADHRLGVRDG